tara:strand:- start:3526 stop:3999 length:474 start_codon:yes stop_codon:yes gene_type:complete
MTVRITIKEMANLIPYAFNRVKAVLEEEDPFGVWTAKRVMGVLKQPRVNSAVLLSQWTQRGLLYRISRGKYQIEPPDSTNPNKDSLAYETPRSDEIVEELKHHGPLKAIELRVRLGFKSSSAISMMLTKLERLGKIVKLKRGLYDAVWGADASNLED